MNKSYILLNKISFDHDEIYSYEKKYGYSLKTIIVDNENINFVLFSTLAISNREGMIREDNNINTDR